MASSAGINRYGIPLLQAITSSTAAVAASGTTTAGYGTLTSTDPGGSGIANDTGIVAVEADAFTKWTFQLLGNNTSSGTVTVFGTIDPLAYVIWASRNGVGGYTTATADADYKFGGYTVASKGQSLSLPVTSWVKMEGPAAQTGTGAIANPLTFATPLFIAGYAVIAVRAVVTVAFTGGGANSLVAMSAP